MSICFPRSVRTGAFPGRAAAAIALACLLAGISPAAQADDSDYSGAYRSCMGTAAGVTASMIDCIAVELQRQDLRLNAAYRQLQDTLKPARRKQLQAVQRLWLPFRDAQCRFVADPGGGTAARVAGNACVLEMTAHRARELEQLQPAR